MDINVYDFNKTIYHGDVTIDFYFFCLKRNLFLVRYLFYQLYMFLKYCVDISTETECKEGLLCFLKGVKDIDTEIQAFWLKNDVKIQDWYRDKEHDIDVIISSAPEFLIQPILESLDVHKIIASKVDAKTGRFSSINCSGHEKINRISEVFLNNTDMKVTPLTILQCYLHQISDEPLALLAKASYIVSKGQIHPWDDYSLTGLEKLEQIFINKDFIVFLIIGVINTLNGVILAYIYSYKFDANIAFVLGYGTSLIISYLLNSRFTFKAKLGFLKFIKFSISYIPNFIIQFIIVLVVFNLLHLPKLLAYALAAIIGVPVTFLVLKVFAFAQKKECP